MAQFETHLTVPDVVSLQRLNPDKHERHIVSLSWQKVQFGSTHFLTHFPLAGQNPTAHTSQKLDTALQPAQFLSSHILLQQPFRILNPAAQVSHADGPAMQDKQLGSKQFVHTPLTNLYPT